MTTNRVGRRGDDLLARVRAAAALDEPAGRVDLVGAVDRDVEAVERVEGLDGQPELARLVLGRGRGRDAAQPGQPALGQRVEQVRDVEPVPSPTVIPSSHQLGGGARGGALLVLGVGHAAGPYPRDRS